MEHRLFFRLATGGPLIGLANYMFDTSIPRFTRGLSLFHVALPLLLVWMLHRLGYDRRALFWQTIVAAVVFPLSYLFSSLFAAASSTRPHLRPEPFLSFRTWAS